MQISEAAVGNGAPAADAEPCRFPKLEECAHFHYERVQLPSLKVTLQTSMDQSLHSQHTLEDEAEWFMVQVTSGDECWLLQRNFENFQMLDDQLHQCIFDRKISQLPDLTSITPSSTEDLDGLLMNYLEKFSQIADNSVNCGPVLNWLQMDNKGHRLLVPSEESRSINTPAVAAAYSVRRYVSQARDELNLEVGDMISVIDMASPGESMWWRGKRGFQVGFFPQHCVHIIGDKVPRNMPLPPPVVGSLALTPIKPVLRKHGKLITFFRSFILNRPSRRRLKQSGILKERVFGCDLGEHLLNSGHEIPMVLKCCAEFIETNGIVDGIYRLSGVTSNIQKLRNAFDEDRIPNLHTEDILQDIHSVASLLKMYFRELPNPLCTYQLYQSFVNAVQGAVPSTSSATSPGSSEINHDRLLKMREAVQKLPPPHYRTLEYLTKHLAKVANHGVSTGMTTRNIAIVWAPNLLRCEALEVGGVAALQGVGVQAVVTEFLICYADLIFCDHLPNLDHPILSTETSLLVKKCRPNSLNISTPTKLITLEEARTKHLLHKSDECGYIEVGGGPKNLPKKYHTVIELPPGARKRAHTKRSPLGWRSLFSTKSRQNASQNMGGSKSRKATTPITITEKSVTESDLTDMKRKLRSVKSAESLTSGHSEPASCEDVLGPLHTLHKPPGHNRSVSHDSYFDTLQSSQNNSEGSLLDLSEIQLNFDLEESEMRIFSEDESLVSSPRITQPKDNQRRILTRARPDDFGSSTTTSVNPSPKKQPRVVLSPDSLSRKRTRLEDQLSDIQFIDCCTPENVVVPTTTTAMIHDELSENTKKNEYQPRNKSPRNSELIESKRQSLNFESSPKLTVLPKSLTEVNFERVFLGGVSVLTTPTPQSPGYEVLADEEDDETEPLKKVQSEPSSPTYENILTTISITYKSPPRSVATSPVKSNVTDLDAVYENVILNSEKTVVVPTSTASLPIQEASQPELLIPSKGEERPKSLNALDDLSNQDSVKLTTHSTSCLEVQSPSITSSAPYQFISSPTTSPTSNSTHSGSDEWEANKRKSSETESFDDRDLYQQVKYFRRSVHEVNALLNGDFLEGSAPQEEPAYDSLEPDGHVYENVENCKEEDSGSKVKELANKFEETPPVHVRKYYEKDSLPPCLRARNLKYQLKTRSLDEEQFNEVCGHAPEGACPPERRKSFDETPNYKSNSLPKRLNQPKELPEISEQNKLDNIHLAHSSENVAVLTEEEEQQKKRERIEKYKEERRKILHDKYRSESFREDKDVLMSRLRIFKVKDEVKEEPEGRSQREEITPIERNSSTWAAPKPMTESLKCRAAIFELNQRLAPVERRRHTYEPPARASDAEPKRISLESNRRKDKVPSYCIKDVKAMFESKSKN